LVAVGHLRHSLAGRVQLQGQRLTDGFRRPVVIDIQEMQRLPSAVTVSQVGKKTREPSPKSRYSN
jgi:hypothetical protein